MSVLDDLGKSTDPGEAVALPLALARLGGLPVDALPGPCRRVLALLDALDRAEAAVVERADPLLDAIYAIVPFAPSSERRRLLAAKRAIHAGTVPTDRDLATVRDHLSGKYNGLLQAWLDASETAHTTAQALSSAVREGDEDLVSRLLALLDNADFLRGLALAAPVFIAHLPVYVSELPSRRLIRTLYRYAMRTCTKTSPFSTLTTVDLAGPARPRNRTAFIAHHLAAALLRAATSDGRCHPALEIVPSPVRPVAGGGHSRLLLLPHDVHTNGIVFRDEVVVGADLLGTPLRAATEQSPRYRRLLEQGVLRVAIPWGRATDPFPTLARKFPEGLGPLNGEELNWIATQAAGADDEEARHRAARLERLGTLAVRVFPHGELGEHPSGLVYEDVSSGQRTPNPVSVPPLAEDLRTVAEAASPWIVRSHAYDLMVARFVDRFGHGGQTDDALGFFMSLAVEGDGDLDLMDALRADRTSVPSTERGGRRNGATAAPKHMGAMVQVVAPDESSVWRGEHLMVVNSIGNGVGAYLARFHRILGEETRARLAREIQAMWNDRPVLELTLWSECNTGQAACAGVLPELVLPGEPRSGGGVPLENLLLRHDSFSDSLELVGDQGPVGLAYLGLTPQHLIGGYARWLALVADPWTKFPAMSESYTNLTSGGLRLGDAQVIHRPRAALGDRVVTRREDWLMDSSTLLELDARTAVDTVRAWHRFRARHGIPAVGYVHQLIHGGGTTNDRRKPQYVDFTSGVSLGALGSWLTSCTGTVRISEALPGPGQHPHRDGEGHPRVSEFAVSLHWPREER